MGEIGSCLIDELRKLKESSKEAVDNLDSFSDFKDYMHIKRSVESELLDLLLRAKESNKSQLILVCGGVGDGKSHLISYLKNKHQDLLTNFQLHNDATESFEPRKTSIDTLNDVLDDFSDGKLNINGSKKLILAINLGALNNFVDSEYQDRYQHLKEFVITKKILEARVSDSFFDSENSFQFINFSDYHMFTLTSKGASSEYINEILFKISSEDEKNPFYTSYQKNCLENCICSSKCPVKFNYEFLMSSRVQEQLIQILIEGIVKYKLIISTRALFNFVYDICVSNFIDQLPRDEIKETIMKASFSEYIEWFLPNLLFEHKDRSNIFEVLSKMDPVHSRSEEMDNLLISLNTKENISSIFYEYIDMIDNECITNILNNELMLKTLLTEENINLRYKLVKLFFRYYKFSPKKEVLNINDSLYHEYMQNLFYWNIQNKKQLIKLYKDVSDAIYKWNGKSISEYINLFIGKNQLEYKISQKLDLAPHVIDLKEQSLIKLDRFTPYLIMAYKTKGEEAVVEISIDFSLYELLMRIKNGYRPNKQDKNNFINFVDFINKILILGNQDKELIFEEKNGGNIQRYKLEYDKEFEQYRFVVIRI
ncbi:DNA phosphorothioation-dependent restriction protein DptF [Cohnella boryungensis]|uniref:DNA phosphorothioation-dependent restriction protein DptF n=1 Tax=Cohnella boryungensis TaxID=768479 RepID=A0ABV8SIX7_9BACL